MTVILSLMAPDLDDEDLQALICELTLAINQELVIRPAELGD
jgi:hypothetical protein